MRKLMTLVLATTLLSSLTATAFATDLQAQGSHEQMTTLAGDYGLSDGRKAQVIVMDDRLYLKIGRSVQELELTGLDNWATRDRAVSVAFKRIGNDIQIRLGYRDDAASTAPLRLASREQRGRGAID